jgi:hypothetical protein
VTYHVCWVTRRPEDDNLQITTTSFDILSVTRAQVKQWWLFINAVLTVKIFNTNKMLIPYGSRTRYKCEKSCHGLASGTASDWREVSWLFIPNCMNRPANSESEYTWLLCREKWKRGRWSRALRLVLYFSERYPSDIKIYLDLLARFINCANVPTPEYGTRSDNTLQETLHDP